MKYRCEICFGNGEYPTEEGPYLCGPCKGLGEYDDLRETFQDLSPSERTWPLLLCGFLLPDREIEAAALIKRWPTPQDAMKDLDVRTHSDGELAWSNALWMSGLIGSSPLLRKILYLILRLCLEGPPRTREDILSLHGADDYVADSVLYYSGPLPANPPPSGDPAITTHWERNRV